MNDKIADCVHTLLQVDSLWQGLQVIHKQPYLLRVHIWITYIIKQLVKCNIYLHVLLIDYKYANNSTWQTIQTVFKKLQINEAQ